MEITFRRISKRAAWIFFVCLLLTACDSNVSFSKVQSIPDQLWYYKDSLSFEHHIDKPLLGQDVILSLRNAHSYPYQNLYLKVTMRAPQGAKIIDDTLQLILADKYGSWKGDGWGSLILNELILQSDYSFQDTGKYVVSIRHLMRDDYLPGIEDVAVSFQKKETFKLKGKAPISTNTPTQSDTTLSKDVAL